MDAGERIKEIVSQKGMNVKTFSELCGYERPQVLYDVINGKTRNISASLCSKILAVCPDVSRVWLLTGEGEMLIPENPEAKDIDFVKKVPLLPISALAGPLTSYYESGVQLSQCQHINSPTQMADMALPISGDSMEPVFADGSIIFIRRINEAAFIPWGHPMVIDTENGVFFKNVMPDDINEQFIWAESINPKYPRMHVPKTSIMGIYRVLNVMKTFTTM